LLDFIETARFERLGIFTYSQEEGSRASRMPGQVPVRVKNARQRETMKVQQRIAAELAAARKGATLRVLVDQPRIARSEHDAPDVDCRVILSRNAPVGEFVDAQVIGSHVYDLLAEPTIDSGPSSESGR
jgi:ribosomal protein S12 methylthiotransferase